MLPRNLGLLPRRLRLSANIHFNVVPWLKCMELSLNCTFRYVITYAWPCGNARRVSVLVILVNLYIVWLSVDSNRAVMEHFYGSKHLNSCLLCTHS